MFSRYGKVKKLMSMVLSCTFMAVFLIYQLPSQYKASAQAADAITVGNSQFQSASDNAYNWLKYQQDNAKFSDTNQPSGLVDSFEDYISATQPGTETFTYDQAVAIIAFLIKGDTDRARKVLNEMQALQASDGSWCNSYWYNAADTANAGAELRKHVGPAMWMALAVENYEKITGDVTTYHGMATKAIDWALTFAKSNGALSGGMTTWDSGNGSWTPEVWSSTEQNEDAYAALSYFASTTSSKASTYTTAAANIKSFLDNVVWDSTNNRFYGGYKNNTNSIDPYVPMDVNPWGVLSLGLTGTHSYNSALNYVENAAGDPNTGLGTLTHPKYVETVTYNDAGNTLTGYDFDWESDNAAGPSGSGSGVCGPDVWIEGSCFMSVAYAMNGNTIKADSILAELAKKQATNDQYCNGGLPYSVKGTNNNYWTMLQQNCVSSTGWFIIAAARWNPFTATSVGGGIVTPTAATPTFSPAAGTYSSAQSVMISTTTSGASIHFTTDGSTPTVSSPLYSSAITVASSQTIKAIAIKSGMNNSAIASAAYIINGSTTGTAIGHFTAQLAMSGSTLTVTLIPGNASDTASNIWYTNVANPTQLSQAIAGYTTGAKNANGNYVITMPNVTLGNNGLIDLFLATNSGDTGWVAMNVNSDTLQNVATPSFSPGAGSYSTTQSVTISTQTAGATIYYTVDGSTPTVASAVYSSPISVSTSETVKAIAAKNGMNNSAVASAAYVINSGSSGTAIGHFTAQLTMSGSTLTVTLIPNSSSDTASNIWYTNIANPTQLSQAVAGYAIGTKNSSGNYVITIPSVTLGTNRTIDFYLATNSGDTGWVIMNV